MSSPSTAASSSSGKSTRSTTSATATRRRLARLPRPTAESSSLTISTSARHAVADWLDATHHDGEHSLLLAGTRAEADVLNRLARQQLGAAGALAGPAPFTAGSSRSAIGCSAPVTRPTSQPDGRPTASTTAPSPPSPGSTISAAASTSASWGPAGRPTRSPYSRRAISSHGYAMTIHKSQGATCDHVYVVGSAGLYREAAYVALSRARHGASLYVTSDQAAEDFDAAGHGTGIPHPDDRPDEQLLRRLHHSQAKSFATSLFPEALTVDRLAHLPLHQLDADLQHALGTPS